MDIRIRYLFTFITSLIVSLIATPICIKLANRFEIIDKPKDDRWHEKPIPRMGGMAIFISFLVSSIFLHEFEKDTLIVLLGGLGIFGLGLIDDKFGTIPKLKFTVQLIIAVVLALLDVRLKILSKPIAIPITVFWIVGITNGFNLIDNMDGLSTGVTVIAALALFGLSLQKGETSVALLSLAIAGSCLGFLKYNFNPAIVFMGDCGSLFLGYILATLVILGAWQQNSSFTVSFFPPVLIMSVVIFDTTLVTILRLMHGRMPWQGGKDHSSHRLVYILGGDEKRAVLILYMIAFITSSSALLVTKINSWFIAILFFLGFGIALIVVGVWLAKIKCYEKS